MFTSVPLVTNVAESEQLSWDMAKQIIQSQHTLAIYGITAVVAVAAGLMLASWIWNVFLRRHELQRAIESLKSEITTKVEEDFTKLTEGINDKVEKMKEEVKKSIAKRKIEFDADTARLFAFASAHRGLWGTAASWWATAIVNFAKVEDESMLRAAVNALDESLKECKELGDKDRKIVKKCLSSIPAILTEEKEQIEDKLKKLPEETKEH